MPAQGGIGIEIGVHLGLNARELFNRLRPKKLHLIDPWQELSGAEHAGTWYERVTQEEMDGYYKAVQRSFQPQVSRGLVEIHRKMSWDALPAFEDNSVDWIYVDGDHSYKAVKRDLEMSYAKVKPGGMIAGDDYKLGAWWGDGIVRAVHELLITHPVKLKLVLDEQFVLEKLS